MYFFWTTLVLYAYLEFLSRSHLSLLTEIFNLCLSEDDVRIAGRILVHVRLGDDEQNIFRFANSDTINTGNLALKL